MNSADWHRPLWHTLIVLFSFVWPFLAFRSLRRDARSSAPLVAMLVPLAVASCGTWLGLWDVMGGMTVENTGRELWISVGIREAFAVLRFGVYSALGVGIVALIRRHGHAVDRRAIVIAVFLVLDLLGAAMLALAITHVELIT